MSTSFDYIVTWTGDGVSGGQAVPGAFAPRSIQAVGIDPLGATGIQLSLTGPGKTLELPAGIATDALVPAAAGGFKADGNANLAGWTYRAALLA